MGKWHIVATSPFLWMYDENVCTLGVAMPYELLYSRTIAGDGVVRYTDVPITDKSVMIEVLSLLSPFRRIAGYAYALRSDGISDYERSGGVTLPFGKNRVTFASATLPYGLEFFPKWGMKTGIISVYIGEPGSPPPPSVPIPGTSERVYIDGASQTVFLSRGPGQPFEDLGWGFIYRAWVRSDGRIYTDSFAPSKGVSSGPIWALDRNPDYFDYEDMKTDPNKTELPNN